MTVTILAVLFCSSMAFAQAKSEAFVMGSQGRWEMSGGGSRTHAIENWTRIPTGTELIAAVAGSEIYLICPADGNRTQAVTHRCPDKNCKIRACMSPAAGTGTAWLEARIARAADYLRKKPNPGVLAGVRGGIGDPQEAVLKLESGTVDLAPAIAKIFEGEHCFLIAPLDRPAERVQLRVSWRPGAAASVRASLAPGLHLIEKASPSCARTEGAEQAWVLLASPADFERLSAEFNQTQTQLAALEKQGFGSPASLALSRALLGSYAEGLAR